MVYCGKPSKSCQACRQKKTRCDKAVPSCSQCIRAKRDCPGYRDQLDLMFRNESTSVIGKVKSKAAAKTREGVTPASFPTATTSDGAFALSMVDFVRPNTHTVTTSTYLYPIPEVSINASFFPSFNLAPTLEERAGAFFSANYEMRSMGGRAHFYNSDSVDTLCDPANMDSHLVASINAVGLAGFSNAIRSPDLMKKALKDYVIALRLTNAALQSPTEVSKDSTLFSVMILSIFETVTGSTQHSFQAWTEHVTGSAALVKLRGVDQFKTHAGRRMFLQVQANLMISCMQRTVPMPDNITELRVVAEQYVETENPGWRLSSVIMDCTNFRAAVRDELIQGPSNIVSRALELDRRFVEIFSDLPPAWQYTTVYTDASPDVVWNSNYHAYQNCWIAQIWNAMRTCRILLHEIIHYQLKSTLTQDPHPFGIQERKNLHRSSTTALIQMRTEILASIPQHTGSTIVENWTERSLYFEDDSNNGPGLKGARSYFVLWPLYLVGSMDLSTDAIRLWVINRLRSVADEFGIRQAAVLADFVGRHQSMTAWERKTHYKGVPATLIPLLESGQYTRYPSIDQSSPPASSELHTPPEASSIDGTFNC